MKTKINLTIDANLIQIAKNFAKNKKISLSALVENLLQRTIQESQAELPHTKNNQLNDSLESFHTRNRIYQNEVPENFEDTKLSERYKKYE